MTSPTTRRKVHGIALLPLLLCYLVVAIAPLGISAVLGLPPRNVRDELASALAMLGFAMLLVEFVLSGRFRTVSGRIGIDATMRFHQLIAWVLLIFLLIHPVLYQTPWFAGSSGRSGLGLTGASVASGAVALLLLLALVVIAALRDQSGNTYEQWRLTHGISAIAIAILGAHHALDAGRYSSHPVLAAYWLGLLTVALLSFGYVHLITPSRQSRAPYRVTSNRPIALKTWELTVEPVGGPALDFEAGQFVWLTLDRSPYAITEHPFTISSCPADRPRIAFTIKEAGNFTNRIGNVAVGASAYLDGPHGNFTLAGREGAGFAFIAGGVGIAPILSILRELRAEGDTRPKLLIYGNRLDGQIMHAAELAQMESQHHLQLHYVLSEPPAEWTGDIGELDEAVLQRRLTMPDRDRWLYFVCGPTPMIDSVERTLRRLGIPLRQIVSEKFRYD